MNRRTCLKSSLGLGATLLMPTGVLALVGCNGIARTSELAGFNGRIMGTGYSVSVGSPLDQSVQAAVHAALQGVDAHMSTWRNDSELTRFNDSDDTDWQPMTEATIGVVARALATSAASHGAFDVTVGPLVDLWGFGPGGSLAGRASADPGASIGNSGDRPSSRAISRALSRVGFEAVDVDDTASALRKHSPHARLDLSGIAKGYAVDRVADVLDANGFESYLVEVGGELRTRGRKPDGSAWRVAIERPEVGQRDIFRVVELEDRAIATSGDYRNFFDAGGQRYSHSVDPRTGRPVNHELASVSVVANSTLAADALSTTLMIMGPDQAMTYAERHDVAAHLILKSGRKLAERSSPAFVTLFG